MWRTVGSTAMANLLGIFALFFVAFAFYHQCEAYKVVPCKDENKKCPEWVMRGLCKQTSKWHAYMKLNCKKSCEMCPIVYTTGGTAKGAACVFPFLYKGRLYTSCVKQSDKSYWCSTTYNYATGKKWGICLPVVNS